MYIVYTTTNRMRAILISYYQCILYSAYSETCLCPAIYSIIRFKTPKKLMYNVHVLLGTCRYLNPNGKYILGGDYMDYSYLAPEGTTISFSCPPKMVLVGPNASTCMKNEEWEPDPRGVECKGTFICSVSYCRILEY